MKFRFLLLCLAASAMAGAADKLTLPRVLREVSEQHPQVRAAQALAAAEREKISQASAWDDPTVGVPSSDRQIPGGSGTDVPTVHPRLDQLLQPLLQV